jgi:hypothetical protein
MLTLSNTLSWFQANQSLLFFLNAVLLAEKQQIPFFVVVGLTQSGLKLTISRTRGEYANYCTTDAVAAY